MNTIFSSPIESRPHHLSIAIYQSFLPCSPRWAPSSFFFPLLFRGEAGATVAGALPDITSLDSSTGATSIGFVGLSSIPLGLLYSPAHLHDAAKRSRHKKTH